MNIMLHQILDSINCA